MDQDLRADLAIVIRSDDAFTTRQARPAKI